MSREGQLQQRLDEREARIAELEAERDEARDAYLRAAEAAHLLRDKLDCARAEERERAARIAENKVKSLHEAAKREGAIGQGKGREQLTWRAYGVAEIAAAIRGSHD